MGKLFGTDGVRGIANTDLTPELACHLGKAGVMVLGEGAAHPTFVIGRDTRRSGDLLESALVAGILSVGGNVIRAGVIPTPGVAYLVRHHHADAGIVISASHNPFAYNGIKFFDRDGYKLDDVWEQRIESKVLNRLESSRVVPSGADLGVCLEVEDSTSLYRDFLLQTVDLRLDGMKIVLDCAHGASYRIAPEVYRSLGAEVTAIGCAPDGVNINEGVGSTHPEQLQRAVVEAGADLGLAYDGDADRLIAVDETGAVVDGDRILCICADLLKQTGELRENRVTATVMSNLGFHKYIRETVDAEVTVTGVGDRHVLASMRETGSILGGEQSGHIIFLNHTTTGDGVLSSLQLVRAVQASGRTLSALAREVEIFPQVLVNAPVAKEKRQAYAEDAEILAAIAAVEAELADSGRVLIRPSGTEPLVRVMLEGSETERLQQLAEELAALIRQKCS